MKKTVFVSVLIILISNQSFSQCSTTISGTLTSCGAGCNGTVIFTSSSGTPPYNLVVTGGPTTQYNSSYTWTSVCPGAYHYDVMGASASCHDTGTVTVTAISVTPAPALTIEAYDLTGTPLGNNPTVCQLQHVDFFLSNQFPFINVLPNAYTWKVNGTPVLVQNNLSSYFNATYGTSALNTGDSVTLEVSWPNACMSANPRISQNIYFTVTPNQPPVLTITDNMTNDTICHGSTVTFTANPFDAGTPTYEWYLDGTPVGTASTYTTPATLPNGGHEVYCIMTSGDYCDTQDPVFNPTVISDTTFFYIDPCYYYVPVTGTLGPYTTCNSPFYDSALDTPVNYSNNANGLVKFCPAVQGQYITISFTSLSLNDAGDRLRIFSGTPSSTWTADTSAIPLLNIAGPVNSPGPAVTSNVSGGCLTAHFRSDAVGNAAGWVANITCSPTVSVPEQSIETAVLTVHLNPATDELSLIGYTLSENYSIEIYNVLGEKVYSRQPETSNQEHVTVNVSKLRSGIYFVKVKGERKEGVAKFVKQ
jgi:hypothetical protein